MAGRFKTKTKEERERERNETDNEDAQSEHGPNGEKCIEYTNIQLNELVAYKPDPQSALINNILKKALPLSSAAKQVSANLASLLSFLSAALPVFLSSDGKPMPKNYVSGSSKTKTVRCASANREMSSPSTSLFRARVICPRLFGAIEKLAKTSLSADDDFVAGKANSLAGMVEQTSPSLSHRRGRQSPRRVPIKA
jgi:hypothetical protein